MSNKIQLRRDTAANWTTANPILAAGEPALETDTGKQKIGTGTTAWTSLNYDPAYLQFPAGAATPAAVVNGQLWWSSALSRFRLRNPSAVLDVLAGVITTVALSGVTIPANGTLDTVVALSGAGVNQRVVVGPPFAFTAGLMAMGFVSSANNVTLRLANVTAVAIAAFSGTFSIQAVY